MAKRPVLILAMSVLAMLSIVGFGQEPAQRQDAAERPGKADKRGRARPITVPVTIKTKEKPKETKLVDLLVKEDGEVQSILSYRLPSEVPLTAALLIQDDLVPSLATETRTMVRFVQQLPAGSHVMVGYIRSGSLDVRRKFTNELEKAAVAVRPPLGLANAGPYNPYVEIIEALRRFDSQPAGRRALVVLSDGLDISRGLDSSSPGQSLDLQRAITEAQRRGVAIYSIYAPSAGELGNSALLANGQSSLARLSAETGGHAYFQGTGAPVSLDPFLSDIEDTLGKQIALTYLSTHPDKGFHKLEIKPLETGVEVRHPAGITTK